MNKPELQALTNWDNHAWGILVLHVPLFDQTLEFLLFPEDRGNPVVTDKMAAIVSDALALDTSKLNLIKDMLWEEANFAFTVADYGVEPIGEETNLEAHLREFEIAGPEDAYQRCKISNIHVFGEFDSRFATIVIETGTSNVINVIIKDGRIIDWDDDGTNIAGFEVNEQAAKTMRTKVMG